MSLPEHEQDAASWMAETMARLDALPHDYALCSDCGGTGIKPEMCCSGDMCGCRGLPHDFGPCPCGQKPPEWF